MPINIRSYRKRSLFSLFWRLCQLVCAIVVCVYYGKVLNQAMKENKYGDARWIYATTVGAISGLSSLAYLIWGLVLEFRAIALLFAWDVIVVILWTVVSGIFGSMYLTENPEMDQAIANMKTAAWFDLVNLLLWMASAGYCGWVIFVADRKLLNEGRAKVESKEAEEGGRGEK